jgi:hypothetical protein
MPLPWTRRAPALLALCVASLCVLAESAHAQSSHPANGQQPGIDRIVPNPLVEGPAEIMFYLPWSGPYSVRIYSIDGTLVTSLVEAESGSTGLRTVSWDGRASDGSRVSNGMYFCRLASGTFVRSKPVVIMR